MQLRRLILRVLMTKGPLRTKNKVLDQKRLYSLCSDKIAGEKGIMDLGVPVPPVADQIWKLRFDRLPNSWSF